jgi:hypothetical protein
MDLNRPLPATGVKVPLYASFTGIKGIRLIALGTNSASPLLRLYEDAIEFKVFRTHRKSYAQLERVDTLQLPLTQNIELHWKGSAFTFAANLGREDWLVQLLRYFDERHIELTSRARALLNKSLLNQ